MLVMVHLSTYGCICVIYLNSLVRGLVCVYPRNVAMATINVKYLKLKGYPVEFMFIRHVISHVTFVCQTSVVALGCLWH